MCPQSHIISHNFKCYILATNRIGAAEAKICEVEKITKAIIVSWKLRVGSFEIKSWQIYWRRFARNCNSDKRTVMLKSAVFSVRPNLECKDIRWRGRANIDIWAWWICQRWRANSAKPHAYRWGSSFSNLYLNYFMAYKLTILRSDPVDFRLIEVINLCELILDF